MPARRHPRHPRRGRLAVALAGGALAAGALLVVTTVVPPEAPHPGTSQSAIPRPTARQILLAAADAIATAPAEGDYWRIRQLTRSMMIEPGRAYVLQRSLSEERWLARRPDDQGWRISRDLGAAPATPEDEAAWQAAGSPSSWQYATDTAGLNATSNEKVRATPAKPESVRLTGAWQGSGGMLLMKPMTWADLGKIPSGPDKLRAYLEGRIRAVSGSADLQPRLREACMQILRGLAVSPDVRAGAYRLLATLPGMRADGEVADPLGRRGQALSYEVEASPGRTTEIRAVRADVGGAPWRRGGCRFGGRACAGLAFLPGGVLDGLDQRDAGGRVGWIAVGGGVEPAGEAGEFGGVNVGSAVGLQREAGQGGDAFACGDEGLHDDHVVAE
ncbi:hypothetical protein GCM10020216_109370 [Nonomuraea helvata]